MARVLSSDDTQLFALVVVVVVEEVLLVLLLSVTADRTGIPTSSASRRELPAEVRPLDLSCRRISRAVG